MGVIGGDSSSGGGGGGVTARVAAVLGVTSPVRDLKKTAAVSIKLLSLRLPLVLLLALLVLHGDEHSTSAIVMDMSILMMIDCYSLARDQKAISTHKTCCQQKAKIDRSSGGKSPHVPSCRDGAVVVGRFYFLRYSIFNDRRNTRQ